MFSISSIRLFLIFLFLLPAIGFAQVSSKKIYYLDQAKKLRGTLYWNTAFQDKRPGIVLYPEHWGLANAAHNSARKLAELGYVVLAADMYGKGIATKSQATARKWMDKVARDPVVWVQRASAALDQLRGSKLVDPEYIVAMGYGFGGGTALQLSYAGYPLKGVVSLYGSMPLAPEESKDKVHANLLLLHGAEDDQHSAETISAFKQQLNAVNAKWKLITYQGVKYGFANPDAAKYEIEEMEYNAAAEQDAWNRVRAFLAKTLVIPAATEAPETAGKMPTSDKLSNN